MTNPFYTPLDEILFSSRIIQINGGVNSSLAHQINQQIIAMSITDPKKPIYLHVNSPGGEVTSGFSIFDTARYVQPEIYTIVVGLAASMGSVISLAAKPENRLAFPNSKFLIHQPLVPSTIFGQASDLEIHARDIIRTRQKINELYAKETGKSIEVVSKDTERDYWMVPEEAKAYGLISRIITSIDEVK